MKKLFAVAILVLVGGFILAATLAEPPRSSAPVAEFVRNPAQPLPRTEHVQQGDLCAQFGLTTSNHDGRAFDCEPWDGSGVNRWIIP
jgi:hypothetical protein